jgi:hypothetical protein
VPAGVLIRELPDGGHEFVLEDPVLARIVVDQRVTLRFGSTDVSVSGPFAFEVDGLGHWLDPRYADSLAPLLSSFPGSARWLWTSPTGELTLVLMQGQRLVVPEPLARSAWSVGDLAGPTDRPG